MHSKLFDKRKQFPFLWYARLICRAMFHHQYSVVQIIARIAQFTLTLTDFVPKTSQLYARIVTQGGNKASIVRLIKKHFKNTLKHFPNTVRAMAKQSTM